MVRTKVDPTGSAIVKVREGYLVFRSNLVSHYNLVDIVKLIPVLILFVDVSVKWFKLGTSRDS